MYITPKAAVGVVLGVIGTGLFFVGARTPESTIDYVYMAIGVIMILAYCAITWSWLSGLFGKDASLVMLAPPLLMFGALLLYIAVTVGHGDMIQVGIGVGLIGGGIFMLFKSIKTMGMQTME